MRNFLRRSSRHYGFWIGIALFFAVMVEFYSLGSLESYVEGLLYDWRASLTPSRKMDPRIVVVQIDNSSMVGMPLLRKRGLGRFPWPREVWARFLIAARRCGVKVVALDILFEDKMKGDSLVAQQMAKGPPVILAETVDVAGNTPGMVNPPVSPLKESAAALGSVKLFAMSEPVRSLPLAVQLDSRAFVPSLDLAVVRSFLGNPPMKVEKDQVSMGSHQWPTREAYHDFLLRWTIPRTGDNGEEFQANPAEYNEQDVLAYSVNSNQHISFLDLLDHQNDPALRKALKGKILLVGASDISLKDEALTPIGVQYGVDIHANAVSALLNNQYYRDAGDLWNWGALFFFSASLAFFLKHLGAIGKLAAAAAFLAGYGILNLILFAHGWWLHLAGPWFSMVLVYGGATLHHVLEAERKRNEISRIYGRYLAPQVRDQLFNDYDEDNAELLGAVREVTVLESDIRGFTSLSENLPAGEVVRLLNVYFTAMIPILYKHGGTWDKFVGDALLAYFGAPGNQPDHAERAVACAVEMQKEIEALRRQGEIPFHVGIGIHSGPVKVGHIGADATRHSEEQKQFTIIGDTVNLAARLCGQAEGGAVILSEATYQALNGTVKADPLGPVSVKGKAQEVNVYRIKVAGGA